MRYSELWRFETARFTVLLECAPEGDPDLSWADAEMLEKLESGVYVNVTFRVRVMVDGRQIGCDYLGNSIHADVEDFRREHIGLAAKSLADGVSYGSYFPDMVRQAIGEARMTLIGERANPVYIRHSL